MNYMEVLLLIQERKEKIVSDKLHVVQTDKHLYTRESSGGAWEEKELPPPAENRFPELPPEPPKEKKKK